LGAGFHFRRFPDALARAPMPTCALPRKHHVAPLDTPFESRARAASAAFPSRELPTFNGLYPSIVTRQLSQ
jgi:hypothetical protein